MHRVFADMADQPEVNEIYKTYFGENRLHAVR